MNDNTYFNMSHDDPAPHACPVCTGDDDAEPCSDDCCRIVDIAKNRARITALYSAARGALRLARRYLMEEGKDHRYENCLIAVKGYRISIRAMREVV